MTVLRQILFLNRRRRKELGAAQEPSIPAVGFGQAGSRLVTGVPLSLWLLT